MDLSPNLHLVPSDELDSFIGRELGPTDWLTLSQEQVSQFAELTRDFNFIHVDPVASAKTPLGGTIVHGFFTLSMLAWVMQNANVVPKQAVMGMNYGLNKVRFLQPVPCGSRIRGRLKPLAFERKDKSKVLATLEVTIEIEGQAKPALIAEALSLYVLG